ncbi:hypothetical protein P154DRAFT_519759 [Amniculicola lignicola CBS 123094]|uniref:F-box domain-containing protein n=1 Tax=Amniculicola lignicola CBS 123094 TaxID=1392246 RepID=A0A6A5WPP1_9PLEO|nr:hypothetical protein P154DRAFT_519759 [Amniculicola lignicola CBS 123094]
MATFVSLPAELKLCIADSMGPSDCFNFARTSKRLWSLCASAVSSHKTLTEKYRQVHTEAQQQTLWKVLKEVLRNPRVAEYIREVQIDDERGTYSDDDVWQTGDEQAGTVRLGAEDMELFVKAFEKNRFLNCPIESLVGNQVYELDHRRVIEEGADAPVIPTLLTLLPNLQTLRFIPQEDDIWLMHGLDQVALGWKAGDAHMMPFQHLTRVDIAHHDTEMCAYWEWVYLFLNIPSLKFLGGHMIGSMDAQPGECFQVREMPELRSNVETLRLTMSCIAAPDMSMILSKATKLKTFVYENGGAIISHFPYHPRQIVADLGRYCAETLEHLELYDDTGHNRVHERDLESYTAGPVYHFQKLKVLRCFLGDLVPGLLEANSMDYYQAIIQAFDSEPLFPRSLEVLHMEEVSRLGEAQKLDILHRLLRLKKEGVLPNLRQVYIYLSMGDSGDTFNLEAKELGVRYHYFSSVEDVDDLFTATY